MKKSFPEGKDIQYNNRVIISLAALDVVAGRVISLYDIVQLLCWLLSLKYSLSHHHNFRSGARTSQIAIVIPIPYRGTGNHAYAYY